MAAGDYNYKQSSQTNDLCMEIIKLLGEKIATQTGTNPDEVLNYQFVAGDYNYGNRSQTDDLLEEIINRLNSWGGGGGGGGAADGNDSIKITANDTTAGFLFNKLGLASSEVLFEESGDGGNESLKFLAQFATRIGEQAFIGTTLGDAKLNVRGEVGIPVVKFFDGSGTNSFEIDASGNKRFTSPSFSAGNIIFDGDTILYRGVDLSNDPRIRFNGENIILQSNTGKVQVQDSLHFNENAGIRINNTTVAAFAGSSYGITNAMRIQTGVVFSRAEGVDPHIVFRYDGEINLDGQEAGNAGSLFINVNGVRKWTFDKDGDILYLAPQKTGYATAAAVQADGLVAQGTICELTDGTLVRKQ